MADRIINQIEHGICTITLNRPDVRNAFDRGMIAELSSAFQQIQVGENNFSKVRVVLLRGSGTTFCAGADLEYMKESAGFSREENVRDASALYNMFESLRKVPIPVVAQLQGAAFGGGLGLLACCDVVIAEEKAKLCFSEVKLGILPAVISEFVLRKGVRGHLEPYMLSGRVFKATQAMHAGLVTEVVASEQLEESVQSWLAEFVGGGPAAVRACKALLSRHVSLSHADYKAASVAAIADRRASKEGQEGLRAFLEKREPSWRSL